MNIKIMKCTVSLFTVLDYDNSYIKSKKELMGNKGKFFDGSEPKILFLDVLKFGSMLIYVAAEQQEGVTPDMGYRYLFNRFGAIHDVTSGVPAAIVKITGKKVIDYKLFIDDEMILNAL